MDPLFHLAERRIAEAERDGAFADLPGAGKPLVLDDLSAVPEELRASYIVLKNAGFVPPELEAKREWLRLCDLIAACTAEADAAALREQAGRAWLRYRLLRERLGAGPAWLECADEVAARLDASPRRLA